MRTMLLAGFGVILVVADGMVTMSAGDGPTDLMVLFALLAMLAFVFGAWLRDVRERARRDSNPRHLA